MKKRSLLTVLLSGILFLIPLSSCGSNSPGGNTPNNSLSPAVTYVDISTVEELARLKGSKENFRLINDISLPNTDWTPIDEFFGILDGNGKKISQLKITGNKANQGLFSTLKGTVKNLRIDQVSISCTGDAGTLGAVCGTNEGSIENVVVSGDISAKYYNNVGGIAGITNSANITKCKNECYIVGYDIVGGIVGSFSAWSECSFEDNENVGKIEGNSNVGGVLGFAKTNSVKNNFFVTISNNKNSGEVNATGSNIGGVIGNATGSTYDNYGKISYQEFKITSCINTGEVHGYNATGGVVGCGALNKEISSCENKAPVTGNNYVGGYIGSLANWTTVKMLDNNQTITGKAYLGGIVGYGGVLVHCNNTGEIVSTGVNLESSIAISCVGGLAGYALSLEDCSNSVDITVLNKGQFVGGLVGKLQINNGSLLKNCKNNAKVNSDGLYVGGIAGYLRLRDSSLSSFTFTVDGLENNGTVTGFENYVGGIFGKAEGEYIENYSKYYYHYISLINCINSKPIIGVDYTGGIFGYGDYINEITSTSNIADIKGHNYVGGYVGFTNIGSLIHIAENHNNIYGNAYVGGIGGQTGKLKNCFNYGNVFSQGTVIENNKIMAYVGGLAGLATSLENCVNEANIYVDTGGQYVGGLVGFLRVYSSSTFTKCTNNGDVRSTGSFVGGLVGYFRIRHDTLATSTFVIDNNVNNGIVSAIGDYVGGIIGSADGEYIENYSRYYYHYISISNCQNNKDVYGNKYVGGILGRGTYVDKTEAVWNTNTNCGSIKGETSGGLYGELV